MSNGWGRSSSLVPIGERRYPGWRENRTGATCGIPVATFDNELEDELKWKIIVIVWQKRRGTMKKPGARPKRREKKGEKNGALSEPPAVLRKEESPQKSLPAKWVSFFPLHRLHE